MEEEVFKVGYSSYLQNANKHKKNWTSIVKKNILKHKVIASIVFVIILCVIMNMYFIYNFIRILEELR